MNNKVSVIVPIYNTAKCLPKCINSILRQTYQNLEIILVNDGSTDDSGKIADEYAKKDTRIKVIHQKNQGRSAARNKGLKSATGSYISFTDSDDEVRPTFIAELLASMNDRVSLSVSGTHYKRLKQKTAEDIFITPLKSRKAKESKSAYILKLLALNGRLYACNNKLYHAKTAKKCHFDESLDFAEDTKFVLDYLKKSPGEIKFVLKPLYVYNFGTESSSIESANANWQNWQKSYNNLKEWLGKSPTLPEHFWLSMIYLRWRISCLRSKRRAK